MTETYKKKLIEVALPLEAINAASVREKSIRQGHPSTLHLWWARRPLAACRAVLFAQLVDDPSEYVEKLLENPRLRSVVEKELAERMDLWEKRKSEPDSAPANTPEPTIEDCAADIERKRLFKLIEDLVQWDNSANDEVLERARQEIRSSCGKNLPSIYDPFSGGGSIPLEAQRLGLPSHGSDLNPVAVMIGKASAEIPFKFKDKQPVHPGGRDRNHYRGAEGLSEDVRFYGELVREKALARLGNLYPSVELPSHYGGGNAQVIGWIWARTVPSPDPAFSHIDVPMVSSFLLSTKKGKEAWVLPAVDKASGHIDFTIRYEGSKEEIATAKKGTKAGRGANFVCLVSGTAITPEYVRAQASQGRIGQCMIAIVAESRVGRAYAPPTQEQIAVAESANPSWKPEEQMNKDSKDLVSGRGYSYTEWHQLFTPRQLAVLSTLSDIIQETRDIVKRDAVAVGVTDDGEELEEGGAGALSYSQAVSVYLSLALTRLTDSCNAHCRWAADKTQLKNMFSRQAIPMTWDFFEANPFAGAAGDFLVSANTISKVLDRWSGASDAEIGNFDARTVRFPECAVISTDPPYYDNIAYADLSDFFYCWMKKLLRPIYPSLFSVITTPKSEELIASSYRHGGESAAQFFFLDGMRKAVSNMSSNTSNTYPATIYYAFKQSEIDNEGISSTGWATFLQAVVEAGYAVVGTWPMRTEMANRMIASGTNALANSVVLVCRKKEDTAEVITRAEFIRALKRELPPAIAELQLANIAPADMPQSAIGPGMGVFSRYKAVLEADDSPMTVKTALQLINHELDEYIGGIVGEFDADTRFAITWFEQKGMNAGDYGTANNIANARGITVDNVKHAGIVESSAGKVRILKRDELVPDWDPQTDTHLTIWECLQYFVRQHEQDGISYDTALLLKKIGDQAEAVKDLAYCLYDISANKRQDAKEATAYNALIADWTELTREAATISDTRGDGQTRMDL